MMLKGMSFHRKHLPTILSTSCFSFMLTIDLTKACASMVILGTKKGELVEGIMEGEAKERLSLSHVPNYFVTPEILATPPIVSLKDSFSSIFLPISLSD